MDPYFRFIGRWNLIHSWPGTTQVWTVWIHWYTGFFLVNTCTVFDLRLGACRCGGQTVCIDPCHFTWGSWTSVYFGTHRVTNPPWIWKDTWSFWESKVIWCRFLTAQGFSAPNSHVVQLYYYSYTHSLKPLYREDLWNKESVSASNHTPNKRRC